MQRLISYEKLKMDVFCCASICRWDGRVWYWEKCEKKIIELFQFYIDMRKLVNLLQEEFNALQTGRSRVRFPMVSLEFFIDIILSVALWLYDSASNRNEYQESFLGGKGGRCLGLTTLPLSCADCLKTWEPRPPGALVLMVIARGIETIRIV
jgi:hypothetical protein